MGTTGLASKIKDGDWVSVRQAIAKLSTKLGPKSHPTYAGLTLTGLTASRLIVSDADDALVSTDLVSWVTGTANQVIVTDDADGTITLSLPQDIHTGADPTFNDVTVGADLYVRNNIIASDVDITLSLSEASGASAVSIRDSGNNEVAAITSDGEYWSSIFSGEINGVAYVNSQGFLEADDEKLSITTTGLGINKATPAVKLDVVGAITSSTIITGEQLTSTDDITMAGLFTNTPAAGDASVILIDGDTNARTYDGGAESTMSFLRTITGSGADRPTDVNLSYNYITMGYDFTGAVTNVAKYIRGMSNRIDYTGDWKITAEAGFLNDNPVHIRALDNLATTQPGNLLQMTVAKDMTVSLYGSNNEALLQSDFDIQAGTITANVYGGKFKGWGGATLNITSGVPVINYYGGYFEAVGTADGTSTAYGGYFTASGADTNYGIYVAAGVALFKEKILLVQTDGNEYISSNSDGYVDYGATTAHRFNNDISFTTSKGIRQGTSDGSDGQSTYLAGGGAFGNSRGACLVCYGNEVGEAPGKLYLYGGNVANGDIILNVENSERGRFRAEGLLVTGEIESSKSKRTLIGGYAVKLTNTTGAVTIAGQLVIADPATDDAVILTTADELEIIGVFLDSGIADDAEAWVVISGIADVAMEDNTAATHGNWVRSSITEAGYADATNADAPQPINQTHFAEIGHCIESVAAGGGGTHILARCILHFN